MLAPPSRWRSPEQPTGRTGLLLLAATPSAAPEIFLVSRLDANYFLEPALCFRFSLLSWWGGAGCFFGFIQSRWMVGCWEQTSAVSGGVLLALINSFQIVRGCSASGKRRGKQRSVRRDEHLVVEGKKNLYGPSCVWPKHRAGSMLSLGRT